MAVVTVLGGGIFGVTAAIALRRRGHSVTLFDPGPIPAPLAESTDISKIVRLDYGDDATYTELMERALDAWRSWSASRFFHETGVVFLRTSPLELGTFEGDSHALLTARGHRLERLDANAIRSRFPAWNASVFIEGYYNPAGGYAESGRVVAHLTAEARAAGVSVHPDTAVARVVESGSRVTGVMTASGDVIASDFVVVAAGGWSSSLVPHLRGAFQTVGQPVFHLAPDDPGRFIATRFPVFAADIARTGYYGFPIDADGIVKIANHGTGRAMSPDSPDRVVTEGEIDALRAFLRDSVPSLSAARIASTRVCVYCDTRDQHFWIAPDPDRAGLVVAAGGSGHAFKFAPLLGDWIARALEGDVEHRFRWRRDLFEARGEEQARAKA